MLLLADKTIRHIHFHMSQYENHYYDTEEDTQPDGRGKLYVTKPNQRSKKIITLYKNNVSCSFNVLTNKFTLHHLQLMYICGHTNVLNNTKYKLLFELRHSRLCDYSRMQTSKQSICQSRSAVCSWCQQPVVKLTRQQSTPQTDSKINLKHPQLWLQKEMLKNSMLKLKAIIMLLTLS